MRSKRVLALDLGGATFKLVLLEGQGEKRILAQARLLELPAKSDPASRTEALKELLKGIPLSGLTDIVSVMDDPFAVLAQVVVPPMPAGELGGAAKWELQRFLAVSPEEVSVDYELLGEAEKEGVRKLKLLAAAFPTAAIREYISFLRHAGIQPTQLIPRGCACAAWVQTQAQKTGSIALLSFGANSSEFLVVQNGHPVFSRRIPVASADFTRGLTAVLMTAQGQVGFTEQEAETVKRSIGIPGEETPELTAKGISAVQLLALLRSHLERLAVEVERSLAFYVESMAETPTEELLLVGGGAHLKGLAEWLKDRLGLEVRVPDPWEGIAAAPGAISATAAAMNLSLLSCMGAARGAGTGLNLLPKELKEAAQTKIQRAVLTGTLTALLVSAILVRVGMFISERTLQMKISAYTLEKEALAPELSRVTLALAAHERRNEEPPWEEILKELSQVVPKEIYLTGLSVEGKEMHLRGKARMLTREPDLVVADLLRVLDEGLFTRAHLSSCRQIEGSSEKEFEIICSLNV